MKDTFGSVGRNEGRATKAGRLTFGIIIRNQSAATPQKKNMKPFWRRPVSFTPMRFETVKAAVTTTARATSPIGRARPQADRSVLK